MPTEVNAGGSVPAQVPPVIQDSHENQEVRRPDDQQPGSGALQGFDVGVSDGSASIQLLEVNEALQDEADEASGGTMGWLSWLGSTSMSVGSSVLKGTRQTLGVTTAIIGGVAQATSGVAGLVKDGATTVRTSLGGEGNMSVIGRGLARGVEGTGALVQSVASATQYVAEGINQVVSTEDSPVPVVDSPNTAPQENEAPGPAEKISVAQARLEEIDELQVSIRSDMEKLNATVFEYTGVRILPEDLSETMPDESMLTFFDHAWGVGQTAIAGASQMVTLAGTAAAGAGVAAVGSLAATAAGVGIMGRLGATLSGLYIIGSALRSYPQNVMDQTAVNMIENGMKDINVKLAKMNDMIALENQRDELSYKKLLVSAGRSEIIANRSLEMEVISRQITRHEDADKSLSLEEFLDEDHEVNASGDATGTGADMKVGDADAGQAAATRASLKPVTVGDGLQRRETLSGLASIKQSFLSFFSPVVQGLKQAGQYVGDLLGITSYSRLMKQEKSLEQSYAVSYGSGIGVLKTGAPDSDINKVRALFAEERELGFPGWQAADAMAAVRGSSRNTQTGSFTNVLNIGENLVRNLRTSADISNGTLHLKDPGSKDKFVNSDLLTTRSICHFLNFMAQDMGANNPIGVNLDDDGTLTVPDNDQRLYRFLAGSPQAMSPLFAGDMGKGSTWREAIENAGRLYIHDFSGRLPGGANCVIIDTATENGETALKLRFASLDRNALLASVGTMTAELMSAVVRSSVNLSNAAFNMSGESLRARVREAAKHEYRVGLSSTTDLAGLDEAGLMKKYAEMNQRLETPGEDYSNWSLQDLRIRYGQLADLQHKEINLFRQDDRGLKELLDDDGLRALRQRV